MIPYDEAVKIYLAHKPMAQLIIARIEKWDIGKVEELNGKSGGVLKDSHLGEKVYKIESGGKLNPPFVEWLMGWPIGWTDLKALETGKFHSKWLMPFQSYLKELLTERNSLT